jgi:hypothetical protein
MNQKRMGRLRPRTPFPLVSGDPAGIEMLLKNMNDEDAMSDVIRERVTNMNEIDRVIERNGGRKAINLYHIQFPPDRIRRRELLKHGFDDSFIKRITALQGECHKIDMRAMYPINGFWQLYWGFPMPEAGMRGINRIVLSKNFAVIYDLAVKGRLRRIRECSTCGRWFYAYRPGERYRFCSDACKDKNWRQTPQGRARRAKYMRDYRRRLDEADRAFQKTR